MSVAGCREHMQCRDCHFCVWTRNAHGLNGFERHLATLTADIAHTPFDMVGLGKDPVPCDSPRHTRNRFQKGPDVTSVTTTEATPLRPPPCHVMGVPRYSKLKNGPR